MRAALRTNAQDDLSGRIERNRDGCAYRACFQGEKLVLAPVGWPDWAIFLRFSFIVVLHYDIDMKDSNFGNALSNIRDRCQISARFDVYIPCRN